MADSHYHEEYVRCSNEAERLGHGNAAAAARAQVYATLAVAHAVRELVRVYRVG